MLRASPLSVILGLLLLPAQALACEPLMRSPMRQIEAGTFELSSTGRSGLERLHLFAKDLEDRIHRTPAFAIGEGDGFWSVVFDAEKSHGVFVSGHYERDVFMIDMVGEATQGDENAYFHRVAEFHNIQRKVLPLTKPLMACWSVVTDAWVQVKLWLKHGMDLEALERVLGLAQPPVRSRQFHPGGPRYVTRAVENRRTYNIVFGYSGMCPHALITAFERNH